MCDQDIMTNFPLGRLLIVVRLAKISIPERRRGLWR
jgi:hypothetical protein